MFEHGFSKYMEHAYPKASLPPCWQCDLKRHGALVLAPWLHVRVLFTGIADFRDVLGAG